MQNLNTLHIFDIDLAKIEFFYIGINKNGSSNPFDLHLEKLYEMLVLMLFQNQILYLKETSLYYSFLEKIKPLNMFRMFY